MLKNSITFVAAVLATAISTMSGCSSTTTTTVPDDAGSHEAGDTNGADGGPTTCPDPNPDPAPYRPPLTKAGLCTDAQLTGFVSSCTGNAQEATCTAFVKDPANVDCITKCIFVDPQGGNAPAYGPAIDNMVNVAGYMDMKGASKGCVSARHLRDLCLYIACYDCTSDDIQSSCRVAAAGAGGVCASQQGGYEQACVSEADKAAETAFETDDKDPTAILRAFCGPP